MEAVKRDWEYNVDVTDLKAADEFGNIIHRRKATVDTETGEILGIVSPRYKAVQNKTLFEAMQEVSKEANLKLDSVKVCCNRSATIFRYDFGAEQSRIVTTSDVPEDKVNFGIELINSFDSRLGGSRFRAFAERLVCTNGMSMPREVAQFSLSSLGELTPQSIQAKLQSRIKPICDTASIWESWATTTPNRNKVGEFISSHLSKKTAKSILSDFDANEKATVWTLYNLVTAYISHDAKARAADKQRFKDYALENIVANKFYTESLV